MLILVNTERFYTRELWSKLRGILSHEPGSLTRIHVIFARWRILSRQTSFSTHHFIRTKFGQIADARLVVWRIIFHLDLKWALLCCRCRCLREELALETFAWRCAPLKRASRSSGSIWTMGWFRSLKFCFASKCGSLIYPCSSMAVIREWSLKRTQFCISNHLKLRRLFYGICPAVINHLWQAVRFVSGQLFLFLSDQKGCISWRCRPRCNTCSAKI